MDTPNDFFLKIEQNLFSKFCYLPQKLGFSVKNKFGAKIINCGLDTSMFNIVCGSQFHEEDAIDSVKNIIRDFDGQPFAWWLGPSHTPKQLNHFLQQLAFIQETTEYAMLCDLKQASFNPKTSDLIIKEATTPEAMLAFAEVLKPYDKQAPLFYQKVGTSQFNEPFRLFVGYLNELPISIGSLFFTDELAGIYDLLTNEGYQGHGFGTAMMHHLINYAQQKGFDHVSLSASSDSGFRIYERLGFKSLGAFECFEWPGE